MWSVMVDLTPEQELAVLSAELRLPFFIFDAAPDSPGYGTGRQVSAAGVHEWLPGAPRVAVAYAALHFDALLPAQVRAAYALLPCSARSPPRCTQQQVSCAKPMLTDWPCTHPAACGSSPVRCSRHPTSRQVQGGWGQLRMLLPLAGPSAASAAVHGL